MSAISVTFMSRYITATGDARAVTTIDFTAEDRSEGEAEGELAKLQAQLRRYAAGQRVDFDVVLDPAGTPFQRQVWETMRQIPYGETWTYGQLAHAIGNPKAVRAVGQACHRNPCAPVVPCHRVVASHGLGGYYGGLDMKRFLLDFEKKGR
jgi:methylated-DNA-[protein]-cysteine S-methyltransferase